VVSVTKLNHLYGSVQCSLWTVNTPSLLRLCIFIIYPFYGFKGIADRQLNYVFWCTFICIFLGIINRILMLMIFMFKVDESWDWYEGLYMIAESFSLNYGFEVEFGLIHTNLYQSWFDLWFLWLNWKNELLVSWLFRRWVSSQFSCVRRGFHE
jgi:hypothetical protein